ELRVLHHIRRIHPCAEPRIKLALNEFTQLRPVASQEILQGTRVPLPNAIEQGARLGGIRLDLSHASLPLYIHRSERNVTARAADSDPINTAVLLVVSQFGPQPERPCSKMGSCPVGSWLQASGPLQLDSQGAAAGRLAAWSGSACRTY